MRGRFQADNKQLRDKVNIGKYSLIILYYQRGHGTKKLHNKCDQNFFQSNEPHNSVGNLGNVEYEIDMG
jgi:hypothetical protein